MNEEIKEKLEKLKEYEAQERKRERWEPYKEMERHLSYMYDCRTTLADAASHQDMAEEVSDEFDLYLTTHGSADIWDAHEELEKQIEAKELEFEKLDERLTEEEE